MVRIHPDPPTYAGAVAQLGEHLLCKQGVVGSIPSSSTNVRNGRPHRAAAPESTGKRRAAPLSSGFSNQSFIGCSLTMRRSKANPARAAGGEAQAFRPAAMAGWVRLLSNLQSLEFGTAGSANARSLRRSSAQCYGVKRLSACGGCLGDHRR